MDVKELPIDKITPYEKNPRFNQKAVDYVKKSLEEFGAQQPIVVDKDNVIVVGHTRRLAAIELGWTTFPVSVAKDLSSEQIRAYRIADNKTAEHADWNKIMLSEEVISLDIAEFNMDSLGFSDVELEGLLHPMGSQDEEDNETPTEKKDFCSIFGVTYVLGKNNLICGDPNSCDSLRKKYAEDKHGPDCDWEALTEA